jgi:predicted transcriptional regulator
LFAPGLRDQRVILDCDLAALYGIETRVLNQAVKRNPDRFPPEFMFQLTETEAAEVRRLRSQSVILKSAREIQAFESAEKAVEQNIESLRRVRTAFMNQCSHNHDKHLKNIFESGELEENAVVSILETTAADGKNYATRFYNLDAIIPAEYADDVSRGTSRPSRS